jgi:hypothetical protein
MFIPMGGGVGETAFPFLFVGHDFQPGIEANKKIAEALGLDFRQEKNSLVLTSEDPALDGQKVPNWSGSVGGGKIALEALQELGYELTMTSDDEAKHIVIAADNQCAFATIPFEKPHQAISCAYLVALYLSQC